MGVVYQITNLVNSKLYIGLSVDGAIVRWKEHLTAARSGRGNLLGRAIRRHGVESFVVKVLFESDTWRELCAVEKRYIRKFSTKSPNGYNLTDGGEGFVGLVRTPEHCAKISLSRVGMTFSETHRANLSLAHKGKPGRVWSVASRRKASVSALSMIRVNTVERARRSEQAKRQHAEGRLGRGTWKSDPNVVAKKIAKSNTGNHYMTRLRRVKRGQGRPRSTYKPETAY